MRFRQGGFIRLPADETDPMAGLLDLKRLIGQAEGYY